MFESNVEKYPCRRGKVRDVYDIGDNKLVIVATDRISAFDWVLPNTIPNKGRVLTAVTQFWIDFFEEAKIRNHQVKGDLPEEFRGEEFSGRTMLVEKCEPYPVECIVRGYLSGSAWKEYQASGSVAMIRLPDGLKESMPLIEPLFTPSTKAECGQHDENISFDQMSEIISPMCPEPDQPTGVGVNTITAGWLQHLSLQLYKKAHEYAWNRGIIIADTKFEWGIGSVRKEYPRDRITLIDEIMTPDSSRYWPISDYVVGKSPNSLDKQYVRDYLSSVGWDKNSQPPELPKEVVEKTSNIYTKLYEVLTGKKL